MSKPYNRERHRRLINKLLRKVQDDRGVDAAIKSRFYCLAYGAPTTPCNQSRNKREGRYAGKTVYEWAYVTGWGMAGYLGNGPRRHRSHYRGLSGLV